jgi:outer membrane protein assembly factor BamE (lipoprotein component of BamABCDE complex)
MRSIIFLLLLILAGCTTQQPGRLGSGEAIIIAKGLDQAQVLDLLGEPSARITRGGVDQWNYKELSARHVFSAENRFGIGREALSLQLERDPANKISLVIQFTADGRVDRFLIRTIRSS